MPFLKGLATEMNVRSIRSADESTRGGDRRRTETFLWNLELNGGASWLVQETFSFAAPEAAVALTR